MEKKDIKNKLKLIQGNYKPGVWMQDSNFSQEDIDFINAAFKQAAEEIDPAFEKLIWDKQKEKKSKCVGFLLEEKDVVTQQLSIEVD